MVVESEKVSRSTTITLEHLPIVDFPHLFLAVQWYDSNGDQGESLASAGDWTVEYQTAGQDPDDGWWDSPDTDVINLNDLQTIAWDANTVSVRVTPDSLPLAVVTWGVHVSANRT